MSYSSSPAIALPLPVCSRRPSGALGLPGTTRSHWRESSPYPARYVCSLPFGPYPRVRLRPSQPLVPVPRSAACVANSSTLSFQRSPEWPFTQRQVTTTSLDSPSSMRGSHRSRLATGLFCEFFHPRRSHPRHHPSLKHLTT